MKQIAFTFFLIIMVLSLRDICGADVPVNKEKNFSIDLFKTRVGSGSFEISEEGDNLKGKSIVTMKLPQRDRIVDVEFEAITTYIKETLEPIKYVCRVTTDNEKTSIISVKIENKKIFIQFTSPTRKYEKSIDLPDKFFILDENFILDQYQTFLKKLNYPAEGKGKSSVVGQSFNILIPQTTSVISKTKKLVVSDISEEKIKLEDKEFDTYKVAVEYEDGLNIYLWVTKKEKDLIKYTIPSQDAVVVLK